MQAKQEEESKKKKSIACPIHYFFAIKYGGRNQRTGGQLAARS